MFSRSTLRRRLLWGVAAACIATLGVQMLIRYFWVLPQLNELAHYNDRLEVLRIKNQIYQRLKLHSNYAYDNAVWDEAYRAAQQHDEDWFKRNFFIKALFTKQTFNGIYFYDPQGELITGLSVNSSFAPLTTPQFTVPSRYISLLINESEVRANQLKPIMRLQFIRVLEQPAAVFSHSIAPTNETGPSAGTMVVWQFIDNDFVDKLSLEGSDPDPIDIHTGDELSILFQHLSAELLQKGVNPKIYQERLLIGVRDFQGKPLLAFSFSPSPRLHDQSYLASSSIAGLLMTASILVVFFAVISIRVVRPIIRLLQTVSYASLSNDYSVRTHLRGNSELFRLAKKIDELLEVVEQQQQKLKTQNLQLEELSNTDALTGLANRRSLDTYLNAIASHKVNSTLALSLLVVDVDYFKSYNDTQGHASGDRVLQQIADGLTQLTHGATDFVARFGGEEFVVILENTDAVNAAHVAANLCKGIEALGIPHPAVPMNIVTVSIGVATKDAQQPLNPQALFDAADSALYQAKQRGRNQIIVAR